MQCIPQVLERLSSLWRIKCTSKIENGPNVSLIQSVLYCIFYPECMLSEVLVETFFIVIV